jgi:hypothetical protein
MDVSIPDGSKVAVGSVLHKVWRVKNIGATAWPAGTSLQFVGGDVLPAAADAAQSSVPLAAPGATVDVSVHVKVPEVAGRHTGYYRMQLPAGPQFGSRMWVDVMAQAVEAAPAPAKPAPATAAAPAPAPAPTVDVKVEAVAPKPTVDVKVVEQPKPAAAVPAPSKVPEPVQAKPAPAVAAPTPVKPAPAAAPHPKYQRELDELSAMGFKDSELNLYLLNTNRGDVSRVINWLITNQS